MEHQKLQEIQELQGQQEVQEIEEQQPPVRKTMAVGFLVGIGAIIPGVSGGAFAVIFGLYDKIMTYIGTFYREFRKKMKFLVPFAIGVGVAVLSLSQGLEWVFEHYPMQMALLFIGLIAGTGPSMVRTSMKKGFRWWYIPVAVVVGGATWALLNIHGIRWTGEGQLPWYMLVITGVVLGFGTVVPGLSSSAMLISIGLYDPMLALVSLRTLSADNFGSRVGQLIWFMGGLGICILLFSKLVSLLYKKAYGETSFGVLGMVAVSMVVMAQKCEVVRYMAWDFPTFLAFALAAIGGTLVWFLLRKGEH